MLRSNSGPPAKPDIQQLIDAILKEDAHFDRVENRSSMRESLVRAVLIEIRDSEATIPAFSRNVSATGIGLITSLPIDEKAIAVLSIDRIGSDSRPGAILSECRWCRPYGKNWHLSGWQFVSLKR